jgi:hypothetical protein
MQRLVPGPGTTSPGLRRRDRRFWSIDRGGGRRARWRDDAPQVDGVLARRTSMVAVCGEPGDCRRFTCGNGTRWSSWARPNPVGPLHRRPSFEVPEAGGDRRWRPRPGRERRAGGGPDRPSRRPRRRTGQGYGGASHRPAPAFRARPSDPTVDDQASPASAECGVHRGRGTSGRSSPGGRRWAC